MSGGKRVPITCLVVVVLELGMLAGTPAMAEGPFDQEIRAIVDDIVPKIKDYVVKNQVETVTVGTFDNRSDKQPSPGTAITLGLKDGLRKQGIQVKEKSGKIRISGFFEAGSDEDTGQPATLIAYMVQDFSDPANPKTLVTNKRVVVDPASTIEKNGLSVSIPSRATDQQRKKAVIDSIDRPNVALEKSRVRTKAESPYGMEVWVDGRPRDVELKDGVPYVSIKGGESFAVKLINGSSREAGISLSIDGINSFTFQESASASASKPTPMSDWTIKAGGEGYIEGWFINPKKLEKFEVTENPKEIAALAINGDASDVGTITAVFKASWAVGEVPPDDEPKLESRKGSKSPEIGVKRGAGVAIDAPPRDTVFGVIRDSITIRYQKGSAVLESPAARP